MLHAIPTGEFRDVRWVDPAVCGRVAQCDVQMAGQPRRVVVAFEPGAATLQILPSLPGGVAIDPPGLPSDPTGGDPVAFCEIPAPSGGCSLDYPRGTTVTLTPQPGPAAGAFVGWSNVECFGLVVCPLQLGEAFTTATITYDPQRLAISILGEGTIVGSAAGVQISCPGACESPYPFGTQVTLSARPTGTPPQEVHWLRGCDEGSHVGGVCTATVTTNPWWVTANFGGDEEPTIPPIVHADFKVRVTGEGTVRGAGLDCGRRCASRYTFGTRVELSAVPARGAVFDHWVGACGTRATCAFRVGPVTSVRAVFAPQPRSETAVVQPQPTPSPPPPPPPPPPSRMKLSNVLVRAMGRVATRRVAVVFDVDRAAAIRISLLRAHRKLATKSVTVGRGRHRVVLRVPRRARAGRYRLQVRAAAGTDIRKVTRHVRLRP